MPINLAKVKASLKSRKSFDRLRPDPVLERAFVRYVSNYTNGIAQDLWKAIEPTLKAVLPEGATTDSVSLETAFAEAQARFESLDTLKERADKIFAESDRRSRLNFQRLLSDNLGVKFSEPGGVTQAALKELAERVDDTADLISTVGKEYISDFKRVIYSGLRDGTDFHSLRKLVVKAGGANFPKWKVERIAVDQYLTAHANINEIRQTAAGITHFFWQTSGDARVRKAHRDLDGKRFAWNDLPSEGKPGDKVRCRCVAIPDFSTVNLSAVKNEKWVPVDWAKEDPRVAAAA